MEKEIIDKFQIKWENFWEKNQIYKTDLKSSKPKFYILDMFPYPSGSGLHIGHPRGYTATDIIARYKKSKGFEVLHPMGFDSFGLPAEQYAIKTSASPKEFTMKNIAFFKKQLKKFGFSYDWSREIITSEPWYFKHTQWIFSQLYKTGLAALKEIEINWSDSLNIVLANEEIIVKSNGEIVAERDGKPVVKRLMLQWVLKITQYADKLFDGLEELDWPESIKNLQRNWIYQIDEEGDKVLHLRDWIFSRQRYWGEPLPIVHKTDGELYLIPEFYYPIELPMVKNYDFSVDKKPPLSNASSWVNYDDGKVVGTRDLNVMPQWAGSCWYYLAYILKLDGKDEIIKIDSPDAKNLLNKWLPVDLYIGGQEHAVLHLLYARFWFIFLQESKYFDIKEPFKSLFCQGMILGNDGTKMSKSKGNVVNPETIMKNFSVDSIRVTEMFIGPLAESNPWSQDTLIAMEKWLAKVYNFFTIKVNIVTNLQEVSIEICTIYNELLEKIENNINLKKFNVCISEMMIFINIMHKKFRLTKEMSQGFLLILSFFAPFFAEEINYLLFEQKISIYFLPWPKKIDVEIQKSKILPISIMINGKVKEIYHAGDEFFSLWKTTFKVLKIDINMIKLEKDLWEQFQKIFSLPKIAKFLEKNSIKEIVYVSYKTINLITM